MGLILLALAARTLGAPPVAMKDEPIVSVIEYLTDAFKNGRPISEARRRNIKTKIAMFDTFSALKKTTLINWLESSTPEMIKGAANLEYAMTQLEQLGLSEKLKTISNIHRVDSMGWWLNKAPLSGRPLGARAKSRSRTAKELNLAILTHEAKDLKTYESLLTPSQSGPNVFQSRNGFEGETSLQNDGFYTSPDLKGGRGTGYAVRYKLDPRAVEGEDFVLNVDTVVVTNKNAINVVPAEPLEASKSDFFKKIVGDPRGYWQNRGQYELLRNRILNPSLSSLGEDENEIVATVRRGLRDGNSKYADILLENWFRLKVSTRHVTIAEECVSNLKLRRYATEHLLTQSFWIEQPIWIKWVGRLMEEGPTGQSLLLEHVLNQPQVVKHPRWADWMQQLVDSGRHDAAIARILGESHVRSHLRWEKWVQHLVDKGTADSELAFSVLRQTNDRPNWLKALLKRPGDHWAIAQGVFSEPAWTTHPDLLFNFIQQTHLDNDVIDKYILNQPFWRDHPRLKELTNGKPPTSVLLRQRTLKTKCVTGLLQLLK